MNRHVNAIAGRLSLRPPQRRSLEILDRITEIAPPGKGADTAAALEVIRSEFPSVTDFEREFPSLCFALATGVGKTRLMGAFISYLHLAHGINNFFVLAPNLTIYNKLIADFTPNTPKVRVQGHRGVRHGSADDHHRRQLRKRRRRARRAGVDSVLVTACTSTSSTSPRSTPRCAAASRPASSGCRSTSARATSITWPGLPDLVLLMDESHRYRASAGVRAINELKPILGLELTATPFVETSRGAVPFKNVIYDYPLGRAMADGFVKEPAVVTRKNFNPAGMSPEEIERLKLEDGVRLHESVKVELETYARESGNADRQAVPAGDRPRHHPCRPVVGADPVRRASSRGATRTRSSRWIPARPARKKTRWSSGCSRWSTPTSRPRSSSTSTCSRKAGT